MPLEQGLWLKCGVQESHEKQISKGQGRREESDLRKGPEERKLDGS